MFSITGNVLLCLAKGVAVKSLQHKEYTLKSDLCMGFKDNTGNESLETVNMVF